jgi:hypothetical protein
MTENKATTQKRVWIGKFLDIVTEDKEEEFAFRIDAELDDKMRFKGTVWEEEFYEQTKLFIDVKGTIKEDRIQFVKTYPCVYEIDENFKTIIDYSKKGHQVKYDGKKQKGTEKWIGEWLVKGDTVVIDGETYQQDDYGGSFEMTLLED